MVNFRKMQLQMFREFFFSNLFCWNNVRFAEKSQDITKFSYTFHSASPNINIVY